MNKEILKEKKYIFIIVIALIMLIGISFAYFLAQSNKGASSNANITAGSLDDLNFSVDKDISISIDQFNFAEGLGNMNDTATATAKLKANNKSNTASYNYYVYFNIESNNYVYTTTDSKPEIILTVTNPNGAEITSIDGLKYVTATNADGTSIKGFDITTAKGVKTIASNYKITSNSSTNYTAQNWQFTVTVINLETDQAANQGHSLVGKVMIQKDEIKSTTLAEYVKSQYTGTQGENNLYLHDSTLTNGAGDGSYRYAGSSDTTNNFVCFGYDSTDGTCPTDNLYRIIGLFDDQVKLIKYDYAKANLLGTDGDYSNTYSGAGYSGTNKGSNITAEIGVYSWNYRADTSNCNNTWSNSLLNKTNLNTKYLNNIGSTWANKIATHTWKVGGNTEANMRSTVVSTSYQNEITSPATNTTYEAKVGLMYVSDYGYAAAPSAWSTNLYNYNILSVTGVNWMYMGLLEWTIAPRTDISTSAFFVSDTGIVDDFDVRSENGVRPVLYLESSVAYAGGNGTAGSPLLIK